MNRVSYHPCTAFLQRGTVPPPDRTVPAIDETQSKLKPIRHHHAEDIQRKLNSDELAARSMLRSLRRPDWHDGIQHPRPNTIDSAGTDHPVVVLRSALQRRTKDSPHGTKSNRPDPADFVPDPASEQRASEGSEVVDADDAALEEGVGYHRVAGGVDIAETH